MIHKALLFGLDYHNDQNLRLSGCIQDAKNLKQWLINDLGWTEQDIYLCTDENTHKPHRANILAMFAEFIAFTQNLTEQQQKQCTIFISYSGHGSYKTDLNGDEKDGQDSVLVPIDVHADQKPRYITDDDIAHLIKQFPKHISLIMLIDACHSGTMADLQYRYISQQKYAIEHQSKTPCRVVMISGCQDFELANEVWNEQEKKVQGLMSQAFLHALKTHNNDITCWKLIKYMQQYISDKGYKNQKPQLCTSRKLTDTSIFISPTFSKPFLT